MREIYQKTGEVIIYLGPEEQGSGIVPGFRERICSVKMQLEEHRHFNPKERDTLQVWNYASYGLPSSATPTGTPLNAFSNDLGTRGAGHCRGSQGLAQYDLPVQAGSLPPCRLFWYYAFSTLMLSF